MGPSSRARVSILGLYSIGLDDMSGLTFSRPLEMLYMDVFLRQLMQIPNQRQSRRAWGSSVWGQNEALRTDLVASFDLAFQ
jgi:hypothetical protein